MTTLCGGGASAPKAGVVDDIVYAEGFLGLIQLDPALLWLVPFIPLLGNLALHTPDLCATDPPGFPTFSASDAVALAIADPGEAGHTARQKIVDTITTMAWYVLCECSSTSTPATPSAPAAPVQPLVHAPAPVTAAACQTQARGPNAFTSIGAGNPLAPTQPNFITGASSSRITVTLQSTGAGPHDAHTQWDFIWRNAANSIIQQDTRTTSAYGSFAYDIAVPQTAISVQIQVTCTGAASTTDTASASIDFYCCGATPGSTLSPCPPDAALHDQVELILSLVQGLYASNSPAIASYAEATVHAGLTGGGTITLVDDTLAIRVDITTDNALLRTQAGTPTYLYDRGFIVPIAAEGPIRGVTRLVYNPQVYQLPAPTDSVGYQLGAGIVASITELVRGP